MIAESGASLATSFQEDGYVAMRDFLSEQEVDELNGVLARFIEEKVPQLPAQHVFYEDKNDRGTLKQIQQLFTYDPFFERMMFGSRFEQTAEMLLGGPVVGKNMQYFNKPPGVGQPTPPHQDGFYFMLKPPEAVTMWLALEDVDEENGCVRYVRRSHRGPMRPHGRTGTLGFSQGIVDYGTDEDRRSEVAFPAGPGDLLVHHALTIHRADGNRSRARTRRALGFIYYRADAMEDKAAHEAYQQHLAEQMKHKGRI